MRINTKCSLALHILIVVAVFAKKNKMTSELIAKSTGSNPVMIRNILGSLRQAGIVDVQRGSGGATLKLDPKEITIWSVCSTVDPASLTNLMGLHPNPSQRCPVGRKIHALLKEPYCAIGKAVRKTMEGCTLADLLEQYYQGLPPEL
ncbi:MAG: Rrf2 family transcriptional regulator [Synergistaceae bacterium]|nr:Rrf2 family transcriptional regulator [Synergistaceae bacterium]